MIALGLAIAAAGLSAGGIGCFYCYRLGLRDGKRSAQLVPRLRPLKTIRLGVISDGRRR